VTRLLIVDDSSTMRAYVRQVSEARGWSVFEAANGIEGLEKALQSPSPLGLMIVDVNMPQMDGYRFVREVRIEPALSSVPIVMMSTEAQPQDREKAYEAGANAYLVKPVPQEELGQLLELLSASLGQEVTS